MSERFEPHLLELPSWSSEPGLVESNYPALRLAGVCSVSAASKGPGSGEQPA